MNKHMPIVAPSVSIEGRVLAKALKPIAFVVHKSSTYPILSCVRLTAGPFGLRIAGTDLDIDVGTTIDVIDGRGTFDVCVPPETLLAIARVAGPAVIALQVEERVRDNGKSKETDTVVRASVDDGLVVYEIEDCIAADAFPSLAGDCGAQIEAFGNGMLSDALRRCERYISNEETRYYLNGVFWGDSAKGREFVATDGHRMVRYRYTSEQGDGVRRIIPRKTVSLLTKFFPGASATIYAVNDNRRPMIEIHADGYTIRSKLIDGTYPEYDKVIPQIDAESHVLPCSKQGLTHALDLVSAMPVGRSHGRAVQIHPDDGHLALKFRSHGTGSAVARTDAPWPDDVPAVGLNAQYLRDNLSTCDGDLRLVIRDQHAPVLILDSDEAMTRVQMPMRV